MKTPVLASCIVAILISAGGVGLLTPLASDAIAAPRKDAPKKKKQRMILPPQDWTFATKPDQWKKIRDQVGKRAGPLHVKDWVGGEPTPDDLQGRIVIYDFWGTWCGPCRSAIPHNNDLLEQYAAQGVKIVGISTVRGSDRMASMAEQLEMRYPTGVDERDRTAKEWGVQWFPYYVVVDRRGVVRAAGLRPDRVEDVLEYLLEEQPLEEPPAKNGAGKKE